MSRRACRRNVSCRPTPKWAWWLILLGGWPLFAARKWLFTREPLALPARNYVYDRLEWTKKGVAGCFAVAAIAAVYALVTLNPSGLVLAWMTAVVTTAGWLLMVPRIWVTAERIVGPAGASGAGSRSVRLGSVHTTAAVAIERA